MLGAATLAIGYSGLGVLALVPALLLCLNRRGVPLAILLVACGQVASMAGDLVYTWLEASGSYRSGHPVDLLWMTDYTLTAAAALVALQAPRRDSVPVDDRDTGLALLLAGLAGLVGYWLIAGRPAWVGTVLAFAVVAMAIRLLLTARDGRRIAVTDPLTGLLNRRAVEQAVRAHEGPLGVVVIELEAAGLGFQQRDDVIVAAVGRLRALVGAGPIVGRTGAAELVLLVPNPAATRATAERLRAAVAGKPFAAVDVLKLDRSFISAMVDSPAHQALVGGVVSLADRVGLPIVAEGVETAEQLEALRTLGCRWAQGYHLGRPAPLSALSLVDARARSLR